MEFVVSLLLFMVGAAIFKYVEYLEEKDKLELIKQESLDRSSKGEES